MNPNLKKLFKWLDKKTGYNYISCDFIIHLCKLTKVPPSMQNALLYFKKSNKSIRLNIATKYMNYVWENSTGIQMDKRMNYRGGCCNE